MCVGHDATHVHAERPVLQKDRNARKGNAEQADEDIAQGQITDEQVGHGSHAWRRLYDVTNQSVTGNGRDEHEKVQRVHRPLPQTRKITKINKMNCIHTKRMKEEPHISGATYECCQGRNRFGKVRYEGAVDGQKRNKHSQGMKKIWRMIIEKQN